MKSIITKWAYLKYELEEPIDYSEVFSEEIDKGWDILSVSTAIDTYNGEKIIVLTALLSKPA